MLNKKINNEIINKLNKNEIYFIEVNGVLYLEINDNRDNDFINDTLDSYNIEYSEFEKYNDIDCIVYSEQITYCECGTPHFNDDYGFPELVYFDGGAYCEKCFDMDHIIDDYINESNKALAIVDNDYIINNHWHCVFEGDIGYHSNYNTPDLVVNKILGRLKRKYDFFFELTSAQPWTCGAKMYIKLSK